MSTILWLISCAAVVMFVVVIRLLVKQFINLRREETTMNARPEINTAFFYPEGDQICRFDFQITLHKGDTFHYDGVEYLVDSIFFDVSEKTVHFCYFLLPPKTP